MAQQIKLKRSAVAGKVPTTAQLQTGELAINTLDGKLFFKRDDNTVQTIVTTNTLVTGSLNIFGSITGSDTYINGWGSVSASLATVASASSGITLQQVTDNSPFSGEAITTDTIIASSFRTGDTAGTIYAGRYFEVPDGYIPSTGMDLASGLSTHPSASIAFRLGGSITPLFMERSTAGPRSFNTIFNRFRGDNTIQIYASGSGTTLEIESTGLGGENTITTIHSGRTILKTDSHGAAGDTSKLYIQGNVSSSDAYINGWGSVSASLSAVNDGLGGVTLQQVTATGNTTTDDIIVNGGDIIVTGSIAATERLYTSRGIISAHSDNIAFTGAPGYTAGYGGLASLSSDYFTGTYFPRYNVAIGTDVLEFVTASNSSGGMQGSFNTAVGAFAMKDATVGRRNVAIGLSSMEKNLSGDDNVAIGESALFLNTSQDRNTAVGVRSLYSLGSGEYNAGLGYFAIASLATGSNNIGIGNYAGYLNTTAENSTFIGYRSRPQGDGQTNQIVIGHDAAGHGSNTVTIGNSSTTDNYFFGNISGSDAYINGWGSVSASLASIEGSTPTLQQVTDSGNTTTNSVTALEFSGNRFNINLDDNGAGTILGFEAANNHTGTDTVGSVVIGYKTLYSASGFTNSVAIGERAAGNLDSDPGLSHSSNTFVGAYAGGEGNRATGTTAIGQAANSDFNTSYWNTVLGASALNGTSTSNPSWTIAVGVQAGLGQPSPFESIFIGNSSGRRSDSNTTNQADGASGSIYIGHESRTLTKNQINEIVIGSYTTGSGTNTVTIGNSNITDNYFSGNISGSDIVIDEWGSVSASLAAIEIGASAITLQEVTDNGATTTNEVQAVGYSGSYLKLTPLANGDAPTYEDGLLYYSADDGALSFYNEEADITLQVGQEFYKRVYNGSGATIANGTPVRVSGSQGDVPFIWPAVSTDVTDPSYDPYVNKVTGIATHDIENNSVGYITEKGIVRGINTVAFAAGQQLFLQTGSAGVRTTPPPFPYDVIQLGTVIRSATNGFVEVQPVSPVSFNIISGLSGSVDSPGDLWIYGANGAWAPGKTLSGSYTINNGNLTVGGDVDSNDITIDGWGSVSASLASIETAGTAIPTLDQVTSQGNTTTNSITVQDLTVNGTGSFAYIQSVTGSAKIIGDAYIVLNANAPSERYAGIRVYDSGSTGETGSLEYDSIANHWFYESANEGYAAVLMSGPKASRGALTVPTSGSLVQAIGNHLYASNVSDLNGVVSIATDVSITGSVDSDDITIDGWGSVSASLASINDTASTSTLQDVTDNGSTTTNGITVGGNINHTSYVEYRSDKAAIASLGASNIVAGLAVATYAGAIVDYVVYDAARNNMRTGTLQVVANSSTVKVTEHVTTDIGNTDGLVITAQNGVASDWSISIANNLGSTFYISYNVKLLKV